MLVAGVAAASAAGGDPGLLWVVPRAPSPPGIDGSLDDPAWQGACLLRLGPEPGAAGQGGRHLAFGQRPGGPLDLTARFWALWDDGYLYLAGVVDDDQLLAGGAADTVDQQDSVWFWFDPGVGQGGGPVRWVFAPGTLANAGPWFTVDDAQLGLSLRYGGVVGWSRAVGYAFEMAIPRDRLAAAGLVVAGGARAGFELVVADADHPGEGHETLLSWTGAPPRGREPGALGTLLFSDTPACKD